MKSTLWLASLFYLVFNSLVQAATVVSSGSNGAGLFVIEMEKVITPGSSGNITITAPLAGNLMAFELSSTPGIVPRNPPSGLLSGGETDSRTYDYSGAADGLLTGLFFWVDITWDNIPTDQQNILLAGGPNSSLLVVECTANCESGGSDPGNDPNVIPLPAAAWLLISGVGCLLAIGRRRT
ncbi:MAG: VPLPA-CTERM sorting domain-containing protein [Pseudomonadota bacterium]